MNFTSIKYKVLGTLLTFAKDFDTAAFTVCHVRDVFKVYFHQFDCFINCFRDSNRELIAFLVLAMITTTVATTTVKDVQRITIFKTEAQSEYYGGLSVCTGGVLLDDVDSNFSFCFLPKGTPPTITEVWISVAIFAEVSQHALRDTTITITLNGQTQVFNTYYTAEVTDTRLKVFSLNISDPSLINSIQEGINSLKIRARSNDGVSWYTDLANEITIFIEYEYQSGTGGLYLSIDKLGLLAPYIALTLTIILAISVSVAYIKHKKKQ